MYSTGRCDVNKLIQNIHTKALHKIKKATDKITMEFDLTSPATTEDFI